MAQSHFMHISCDSVVCEIFGFPVDDKNGGVPLIDRAVCWWKLFKITKAHQSKTKTGYKSSYKKRYLCVGLSSAPSQALLLFNALQAAPRITGRLLQCVQMKKSAKLHK